MDMVMQERTRNAIQHMEFVCELYREQIRERMYFLHEHLASASSWELGCMRRLAEKEGVYVVIVDMCQYGLKSTDVLGVGFVNKPTMFMTNSIAIARRLMRRCQGGHRHVHLIEGRAAKAAEYTTELCRAICQGLVDQKRANDSKVVMLSSVTLAKEEVQAPNSAVGGSNCTAWRK